MKALEVEVDITPDGEVRNAHLPASCRPWFGSLAKLIMVLPDVPDGDALQRQRVEKWRALLKETQALPQARQITEADIAAEIEAYRSGQ
jgi:hypothetical protein